MDAEPDLPDIRADDPRWVRCAVYTRQSARRPGDAEWEREIIRERIADQRGAIKARGERSAGRVPLGYRTDRLTKQLMIDEGAAAVVRWFFSEADG